MPEQLSTDDPWQDIIDLPNFEGWILKKYSATANLDRVLVNMLNFRDAIVSIVEPTTIP